ncbi:nucleolar protein dao-5-like isoform X2 [Antennarius striatus]|uniref:nucleolar protein dao-5-like isoform X2 n=1 Tax=Antennarius striatus TaxID=241820 RepID=UPI0035B1D6A9
MREEEDAVAWPTRSGCGSVTPSSDMDCSVTYVPTNAVRDSPDGDSSSSEDLIPLAKLLERPQNVEKSSSENKCSSNSSSVSKCKKAKIGGDNKSLDDTSDDNKPLTKKKKFSPPAQKQEEKVNVLTRNDHSSDDKPLTKMTKVASKAVRKPLSTPKETAATKKKECPDDSDASDDVPLSVLAKKCYPKRHRKTPNRPLYTSSKLKSKRNASKKTINYAESSSDSSDNQPLATLERKLTKSPLEEKTSANGKNKKVENKSLKDSNSSDDDVPLVDLITKKKPVRKDAKKRAILQSSTRKTQESSDKSSDDEPLINLKKKRTPTKKKNLVPKKRGTSTKKPRKMLVRGSTSNSSDIEMFTKAAPHPQVTKMIKVILQRCDDKEVGDRKT